MVVLVFGPIRTPKIWYGSAAPRVRIVLDVLGGKLVEWRGAWNCRAVDEHSQSVASAMSRQN